MTTLPFMLRSPAADNFVRFLARIGDMVVRVNVSTWIAHPDEPWTYFEADHDFVYKKDDERVPTHRKYYNCFEVFSNRRVTR